MSAVRSHSIQIQEETSGPLLLRRVAEVALESVLLPVEVVGEAT